MLRADGRRYTAGDRLDLWLRPFEVLMLEVTPRGRGLSRRPVRGVTEREAAGLGTRLALQRAAVAAVRPVVFADAARFERQGLRPWVCGYSAELAAPEEAQARILAVPVRLRRGEEEWRYSPAVAEIVQVVASVGEQRLQLVPVPDARQFGNTQKAGCSWVVYKVRLVPEASARQLQLAVHAWLPEGVEAHVEAWLVRRWWHESARPMPDGYYAEAPS